MTVFGGGRIFMLNEKEEAICVTRKFYDILERIRYPEIAQIDFVQFECTILSGAQRIGLLHWILQNSSGFDSSFLNKLKDNALEDKLFNCYSEIGLCDDINIFLGKCDIDKQLNFFTLLILFIKNIYDMNAEENKQIAQDLINDNNGTLNNNFNTELLNENERTEINTSNIKKILDFSFLSNISSNELYKPFTKNLNGLNELKIETYEPILEKFNATFTELVFSKTQDTQSNVYSKNYIDLCIDLQNIHSSISTVNKTLKNEDNIKSQQLPEILNQEIKINDPLTTVIKNNLVLNEQAQNILKKN